MLYSLCQTYGFLSSLTNRSSASNHVTKSTFLHNRIHNMASQTSEILHRQLDRDWEYMLIEAYEEEECLWWVNSAEYKNKIKRMAALRKISEKTERPGELLLWHPCI